MNSLSIYGRRETSKLPKKIHKRKAKTDEDKVNIKYRVSILIKC